MTQFNTKLTGPVLIVLLGLKEWTESEEVSAITDNRL